MEFSFFFFFVCKMSPKFEKLTNNEICTFLKVLENYLIIWNIKLKIFKQIFKQIYAK